MNINEDQVIENQIETDLDDKYMQNEGKDYFINKKEAIEKEKLIKNTIQELKISSAVSENIDLASIKDLSQ